MEPTEEPEPGAIEVQVEDANGDAIEDEGTCLTIVGVTDSVCDNQDGDQDDDAGVLLIEDVPAGTWTITMNESPDGFEVGSDVEAVDVEEGETTGITVNLDATVGIARIVAVDTNQQPLPGACWSLLDGDDEVAAQCDDDTNGGIADDGFATLADITPGTYTLHQTQTPPGYLAVDDREITVAAGENDPFLVEHEAAPGTITVTTVDGDGNSLDGACYALDGGSEDCGDGTTVSFEDVAAGSHTIVQSTAPDGFTTAGQQLVDLAPGGELDVEFVNDQPLTGSVLFTVTLDDEPLGGTCVGLVDAVTVCDNQDGDSDGTAGVILIDGILPGDYTAAISNTPSGIEDPGMQDVTVTAEETAEVAFALVSLPPVTVDLTILIQDTDGNPVANGCVVLSSGNAVVYGPVCDNADGDGSDTVGTIVVAGVQVGSYAVSLTDESTANIDGFLSATEPSITVEDGAENVATITVELEQAETTGAIELVTVNNATSQRISGLCYELRGATTIAACDGDASDINSLDGVIRLIEVPAGEYDLVLTNLPEGYRELAARTVTVDPGVTNTYEIRLDPLPEPATLTVLKVDPDDEPLTGACFAVRKANTTIQTACDSSNGQPNDGTIVFEGLAAGTYLLVETRAPSSNYQVSSPIEFTVVAGQQREISVINYPRPGRLVITKVDSTDATLKLENACFSLEGDRTYGPFCDGDDGTVDGRTTFSNVAPGDYTLVETTAPAGYLPADDRDVRVNPGASLNLTVADEKAPPPEETGDLVVSKVDTDGDPLAGACFRLFDGNAPVTAQVCDNTDGANDGAIRFNDVPVGTWTLRETVTPSNNYQWADPQDVEIRNNRTTNATVENELKPGRVQVNKRNPEGQPLQGACFDLQGDGAGQQCTNTNGVAIFSGLEPGTYTLVETQAPQGFEPAANVSNIQVRPGQTTIINVVNQRTPSAPNTGSIQVQKFFCPAGDSGERTQFFGGAQGAQELSRTAGCTRGNATFTLIGDDGKGGPGQFSTGADGQHQMTVPEGLYRLTETDPDLEGNSSVRVRISRGQMTTVIVINYIAPPEPEVATVEVWKWTCTPSFNGTLWQDFAENCSREEQLTNGITVRLEGPVTAKAVTGDGGQRGRTTFTDLQPGSYTIYEERPVSIPVGYLFCGFNPDQPDDWKAVNGSLTIRIEYGQTLTCQFFNIPPDLTPDTGTILVHKYVCEIETPAKGYNFEEECRLSDQGVSFSLAWFNGERNDFDEPVIGTANPDGILWFTRLEPGTYRLREVDALWCHAESDSVNADGDVVVQANQLSEVWVYNCVPPDEPPNTGSGDAAPNPPPATLPEGEGDSMPLPSIAFPFALAAAWFGDRKRLRHDTDGTFDRAA